MRSLALCYLLFAGIGACTRVDEPAPAATHPTATAMAARPKGAAATARTEPSSAAPTAADPAPACVATWPSTPAPKARPAASCPPDPEPTPPTLPRGRVVFVDAPGAPSVDVELARTPDHRQRGLMYRTALEPGRGMLFSWTDQQPRRFWMRNTCVPLDMLFIAADGTVAGILEQVPTMNDEPRGVPCPAQHVLEVNAGFSRSAGVRPGQRIRMED